MKLTTFATVTFLALLATAACRAETRAYRFTARITDNGGVRPFQVGSTISGLFVYDVEAKDQRPNDSSVGWYASPRNRLVLRYADQRFAGAGPVTLTTSLFPQAEHVGIVAHDLELPPGWEMGHGGRSDSYGIVLQNSPPRGVVPDDGIPNQVDLSSFVNTRELRLDFFDGVSFPGGHIHRRATVQGVVETLEMVPPEVADEIGTAPGAW